MNKAQIIGLILVAYLIASVIIYIWTMFFQSPFCIVKLNRAANEKGWFDMADDSLTPPAPARELPLSYELITLGPREWQIPESVLAGAATEGEKRIEVIEKSAYDQCVREKEELEKFMRCWNRHVLPGECDSIDSIQKCWNDLTARADKAELELSFAKDANIRQAEQTAEVAKSWSEKIARLEADYKLNEESRIRIRNEKERLESALKLERDHAIKMDQEASASRAELKVLEEAMWEATKLLADIQIGTNVGHMERYKDRLNEIIRKGNDIEIARAASLRGKE